MTLKVLSTVLRTDKTLMYPKSNTGQLLIELARKYLQNHEWRLACRALEAGLLKGGLKDLDEATNLPREVCDRLGARYV